MWGSILDGFVCGCHDGRLEKVSGRIHGGRHYCNTHGIDRTSTTATGDPGRLSLVKENRK
eukprot:scaffold2081_cov255-Amphora_coffeaeformis.AAC.3